MSINGKWLKAQSDCSFQSYNPATGEAIGQVPPGDGVDAIKAIDAAATAFEKWSTQTAYQRSHFLYEAHALMMEELERLAAIMTEEQGEPIQAADNEVKYGADFYCGTQKKPYALTAKRSLSPEQTSDFCLSASLLALWGDHALELSHIHDHPKSGSGACCWLYSCAVTVGSTKVRNFC